MTLSRFSMIAWCKTHWKLMAVFFVLFALFFTNAFHEQYPDEFDSIVGGRYIAEGQMPYRDWFQHHQPGAYVMAAAILPFSGRSFVKFRIGWESVLFGLLVTSYVLLKRRLPKRDMSFYLLLLFVLGLSATYFWGHMLLADTLAGYLLLPSFALLFLKDYYREKFETRDLAIVGGFAFLSWFTSMTYIFIVAAISVYALILFVASPLKVPFFRRLTTGIALLAAPYVVFVLYLLLSGSIADYYWANVVYNADFYIYNYPREPGHAINPIRYAAVIVDAFINNYMPALWGVTGFPLNDPVQVTLAFSNFAALVLIIIRGRWILLIPFLSVLVFSNARSNPQKIQETDYQAFVYIITSMFNGLFALWESRKILNKDKISYVTRVLLTGLYAVLLVYWIATPVYFGMKMEQKFFPKYMGTAPLIYSRPQVAQYVNAIVPEDEYAYIGPFEFEELLYLNAKQPSAYHWFLDHAARSKIKDELLADLEKNRPMVIVFQRNYSPWGGDPKSYNYWMQEFLDKNYFRIFTLNRELSDVQYAWKLSNTKSFDIDGTFNFDKNRRDEILQKLLDLGYIEMPQIADESTNN